MPAPGCFDATGDRYVKVRVAAEAASPAGEADAPRPGRILWSVGLGQLKNGDAAGDIQYPGGDRKGLNL